ADVNGDDSIDMKDVLLMRKFIAKLIPEFPAGPTASEEPSEDSNTELSEEPVSVDPETGLYETVVMDQDVNWTRTAKPEKVGSWIQVREIRADIKKNGAIRPEDGEYYEIKAEGFVSSGTATLYVGENVSWAEFHGDCTPLTTEPGTATLTLRVPIYGVEGELYLCDTGDLGHTLTLTHVKISVFRKPGNGGEPEVDFDPAAYDRQPDQITVTLYDADATGYGVTWHTYAAEGTHVLQYVKADGGEPDFSAATTVPATTEVYQTKTMPYDYEHNTFVYGNLVTEVSDYAHKAALTGLDFAATYAYRVGDTDADIWSEVGYLTTRDETQGAFSFVYLSDTQEDKADDTAPYSFMQKALQGALAADPDAAFIVNGGDIVQCSKYLHLWRSLLNGNASVLRNLPMMPVTGNHDSIYSVAGDHEILKHFCIDYPAENNVPEFGLFYSYNYGDVHFVVLNTDCFASSGGALDDTQLAWLNADLAANTQPWTIVMMHRPMFAIRQVEEQANRAQLLELLNDAGVDLVIQAHEHLFMRSYPIDGSETVDTAPTTRTEDGVEYFVDPNGIVFVTCATAGADGKPPMDAAPKDFCHTYGRGYPSSWASIKVDGNRLTVSVNYETEDGTKAYENGTFGILKSAE
ncbi:MAG: metallophosphoesterase, partial [Clostridia bacterium]|nr:metallophosphoesterase [Clostridia bacterium]